MAQAEHLVIDGYNVIHAWHSYLPNCPPHHPAKINALAERIRIIHDFGGVRTTLVFDGKGRQIDIQRPCKSLSFSLLFTPAGMSADCFIEQLTATSVSPQNMTIVTQDTMIRETVTALGALCLSPGSLDQRIIHCEKQLSAHLQRRCL